MAARLATAISCLASAAACPAADSFSAVLIRFDTNNRQTISRVDKATVQLAPGELGIVVWDDAGGQRWQVFHGSWSRPGQTADNAGPGAASAPDDTRGGCMASPNSLAQLTTQLDPLLSPSVIKAAGEAASAPKPPPPAQNQRVLAWLDQWQELAGGRDQPLYVLGAVEYLLAQQPRPYLTDALDLLDTQKPGSLSPYLASRRRQIVALLRGSPEPPPEDSADDATGVAEIDRARRLIARGRWTDAMKELDAAAESPDARTRALADLYRAVVHAESGLEEEAAADFYFRRAIAGLRDQSAADRFRAHNNYGNFLLGCTQDRLFNHAFQLAAGTRSLFATALLRWKDAQVQYEAALHLAEPLGAAEVAAVDVNLARLYAVLSDVLRTLDSPLTEDDQLDHAEQALERLAGQYASHAIGAAQNVDPYVVSAGEAIRAQLAFRAGRPAAGRQDAVRARDGFVRCGSLAGVETMERMLGMYALRWPKPDSQDDSQDTADKNVHDEALRHFRISHLLAELLRDQVPPDRVGQTRAGFFARRVYVNEQLVELLIEDGQDAQALQYAELAKARALEDLLSTRAGQHSAAPQRAEPLETILAAWPADVVALEYFLTTERAWVFVVDTAGRVKAHPLTDAHGQPLAARDLVARVRAFLQTDFNQYATVSRQRILAGRGFDHQWQDTLHRFCQELLPDDVLAQVSRARTLLVVPHHILHYFPFAAVVTERDTAPRGPLEMVSPRFLVEQPCSICYAPSLTTWHMLRERAAPPINQAAAIAIADLPGAPPLPGVTEEIRSLKAALGRRLNIAVTNEDAHRENALALLGRPGMLLVSTHGQNWPDQPLASELLLYPRGRDDGRLTAAQLYKTNVRSDLVVLSACYTGLADRSPLPGDDLFGLQRALLQSGCRTVIAGQWDIYDQTGPELMHYFFQQLAGGRSVPRALAESQRQFLSRLRASAEPEPWLHPYFWAVYTAAGDDRTTFRRGE